MVNTPAFYSRPRGEAAHELPNRPFIVDYAPFPVCSLASCTQAAQRETDINLKATSTVLQSEGRGRLLDARMVSCATCRKAAPPGETLSLCSRCRAVRYCSKACQQQHWRAGHKQACTPFEEWTAADKDRPSQGPGASKAAVAELRRDLEK